MLYVNTMCLHLVSSHIPSDPAQESFIVGACYRCLQLSRRLEPLQFPRIKFLKAQPYAHSPPEALNLCPRVKMSPALWVEGTASFDPARLTASCSRRVINHILSS